MLVISFLRSRPGRVLKVAAGVWLLAYGATHTSLLGLVLMMAGIVPLVTGLAGICLLDALAKPGKARALETANVRLDPGKDDPHPA